ncbi:DUF4397 domain-containing protein [Myroides odoratimimus]|uniref:DUF4397 domain-containing protein n=1 Tax=Myroides TaxID=76831 RepID=UPI00057DB3DD|nr:MULTISPECIES: DUF4397 domain-containing protein [Myroides]AJA69535.1 hypothetical protein MYRA21_2417 [Myroides sp. A21]MDM1097359.1 DUF4397 domain-containing protein [Myroides odoratimimus]MDM1457650.1 DUF4397 domain-containing protein [Myroides odoratimimus]MEC4086152.1 DUF4397 domain-containing protein [Myroides odoratimimus]
MKRVLSLLTVLLLSFAVFSCSSDDDYIDLSEHAGGFTMVNAYESEDVLIYVADGRPIQSPYYPLFYQSVGYVNLWQGNRLIDIYGGNKVKPITTTTKKITSGQFYTSFIGGNESKVIHFITEDNVKKATPLNEVKQSGVRFFNLSSDNVVATVQFNDKTVVKEFENRVQDSETTALKTQEFNALDSNTYAITIKDKDGKVLATRKDVVFKPSQFYSIILIGAKDNAKKPYYIGVVNQAVK